MGFYTERKTKQPVNPLAMGIAEETALAAELGCGGQQCSPSCLGLWLQAAHQFVNLSARKAGD